LDFFKTTTSLLKQAGAKSASKPKPAKGTKGKDVKSKDVTKEQKVKKERIGPDGKPLPPKPKSPNFFDLAFQYIDFGVGKQFRRILWDNPNNYWTITRVKITNLTSNRKRGSAWGILTWKGVPEDKERKITGVLKRQWKFAKPDPTFVPPEKPHPVGW